MTSRPQSQEPFFRESGAGPSVVCLHATVSTSAQWRPLMDRLAGRFRVFAVDLYGAGKTAAWPQNHPMRLDDEVDLLRSVFLAAGDRFHLIGHSYGAAIALKAALAHPHRLISLVVYEPVLFSILMANAPHSEAVREIVALRDDTMRLLDEGDLVGSAQRFVDYWSGDGAWTTIPESRRPALAEAMRAAKPEWHALVHDPTPLEAFAAINPPTLLLSGTSSKASTLAIARLLTKVMPRVRVEEIQGAGHMAPVAEPERINPLIEKFLETSQLSLAGATPGSAGD